MSDKIFGYVGLAKRAGLLSSGTDTVLTSVRSKKAQLVIIAQDASDATKKRVSDKCSHYGVKLIAYSDMEALGKAIGKEFTACVSINDKNLANAILDSGKE